MSIKERKIMIGRIKRWLENDGDSPFDILAQLMMEDYTIFNLRLDLKKYELEQKGESTK